jgi:hypothetical protein
MEMEHYLDYAADVPSTHIHPNDGESAHRRNTYQSWDSGSTMAAQAEQQRIASVAHVGLSDALIVQKPYPWTKTMFKLYFFLFIAYLNSCINGYDGSLMGGINAMDAYQEYVVHPCWGNGISGAKWCWNKLLSHEEDWV